MLPGGQSLDNVTLLKLQERRPELFRRIVRLADTLVAKGEDYAGSEPYSNLTRCEKIGVAAWKGCLVRLLDKVSRLEHLSTNPAAVTNESFADTCMDLAGYAILLSVLAEDHSDEQCGVSASCCEATSDPLWDRWNQAKADLLDALDISGRAHDKLLEEYEALGEDPAANRTRASQVLLAAKTADFLAAKAYVDAETAYLAWKGVLPAQEAANAA